jgi:hypothetical protein
MMHTIFENRERIHFIHLYPFSPSSVGGCIEIEVLWFSFPGFEYFLAQKRFAPLVIRKEEDFLSLIKSHSWRI